MERKPQFPRQSEESYSLFSKNPTLRELSSDQHPPSISNIPTSFTTSNVPSTFECSNSTSAIKPPNISRQEPPPTPPCAVLPGVLSSNHPLPYPETSNCSPTTLRPFDRSLHPPYAIEADGEPSPMGTNKTPPTPGKNAMMHNSLLQLQAFQTNILNLYQPNSNLPLLSPPFNPLLPLTPLLPPPKSPISFSLGSKQ